IGSPQMVFEDLTMGVEKRGVDLPETPVSAFSDLFWRPEESQRPWTALMEGLAKWTRAGDATLLSFRTARSRSKFLKLAQDAGVAIGTELSAGLKGVAALVSPLRGGMVAAWRNLRVLSEDVIQPEKATGPGRGAADFKGLTRYDDLADGDLLVHRDYGLARFSGLHHMDVGAAANDYLLLRFDGDDKLFLPVDRINLVQRYKGPEGASPALDRLGSTRWTTATARARKAIEKIAQDLVEMYAYRRISKGFSYGEPDEVYREFESTFGFDETPDQERAVRDVLADMAKDAPMDRLVCGDVGFGKTEVALRAAFRAACEGRQVALLCPTTVLAEQHYQTFRQRMDPFPVKVGMLSRFVTKAHQKTVLAQAKSGEVDILIGTHRLLSKDVELPNLGLMILDEEQRFGVKHKEKLKKLRQNIDVLALTATPIPRTLQLSLSGIRELSVIETPPVDRKPVETALMERDEATLRGVLKREMERGGQVFWVHNRVKSLARSAELVKKLVPEARIAMAHGQMNERELEDAMHRFWHREVDVLVSTAIVESGLDFPNANTLVVDQAQLFGLGQLYQLRGRVGRSERQAYAYFVVPSLEDLPEISRRRLRIILDMDYLGAGFRIAMEDLRLRGAGNILGEAQSGQIARVGLDLFLEMLEEEVRRLQGEAPRVKAETELSVLFAAHIPAGYVPDARERLRYYRALSEAKGELRRVELGAELRDRFGAPPEPVENFLEVLALKETLQTLGAGKAELFAARVGVSWAGEQERGPSPEALLSWIEPRESFARLRPPGTLEIRHPEGAPVAEGLRFVRAELDALAAEAGLLETQDANLTDG
ncbi:MAG: transcription-repair coupling factor, partial [Desulfovibrionaceae bacterium]